MSSNVDLRTAKSLVVDAEEALKVLEDSMVHKGGGDENLLSG